MQGVASSIQGGPAARQDQKIVAYLLDASGSMSNRRSSAVSGYNEFLRELRVDTPAGTRLALTRFNTEVFSERVRDLSEVKALTVRDYQPNGNTALYDAIGLTIYRIEQESGPGAQVVMVIYTDGEENSSREWNERTVADRIKQLEATGRWTFLYMGVEQAKWVAAGQSGRIMTSGLGTYTMKSDSLVTSNTLNARATKRMFCSGPLAAGQSMARPYTPEEEEAAGLTRAVEDKTDAVEDTDD